MGEKKDKVVIKPVEKDCRILVNGSAISGETKLDHNDRIVVGSTHIWIFQNPLEKGRDLPIVEFLQLPDYRGIPKPILKLLISKNSTLLL